MKIEEENENTDSDQDCDTHLRSKELKYDIQNNSSMKRVKVEAIDFDWVFEGNNCKTLIKLLANKS